MRLESSSEVRFRYTTRRVPNEVDLWTVCEDGKEIAVALSEVFALAIAQALNNSRQPMPAFVVGLLMRPGGVPQRVMCQN